MSFPTWSLMLFTRFDAPSLLAHEVRRLLLERLRHEPGLSLREAARLLDVPYSTLRHHARMLDRAGHAVLVTMDRARLYPPGRRGLVAPRALRALEALRAGVSTPAALARALDIPRGTAGSLLEKLEGAGLATREGGQWRLTDSAMDLLCLSPSGAALT